MHNGLPLPGRQPNYSKRGNNIVSILSSDKSKADTWELYYQEAVTQEVRYRTCDLGFKDTCIYDIYNIV